MIGVGGGMGGHWTLTTFFNRVWVVEGVLWDSTGFHEVWGSNKHLP